MLVAFAVIIVVVILLVVVATRLPRTGGRQDTSPGSPGAKVYDMKIVGVTHPNADGSDRQSILGACRPGDQLRLQREPGNAHDRNAIAVLKVTGEQIGYVRGEIAAWLAPDCIDKGRTVRASVKQVTGGTGDAATLGCVIRVEIER